MLKIWVRFAEFEVYIMRKVYGNANFCWFVCDVV